MSENQQAVHGDPRDHESDPAHNIEDGNDWTDEGGAAPEGPATYESASHRREREKE